MFTLIYIYIYIYIRVFIDQESGTSVALKCNTEKDKHRKHHYTAGTVYVYMVFVIFNFVVYVHYECAFMVVKLLVCFKVVKHLPFYFVFSFVSPVINDNTRSASLCNKSSHAIKLAPPLSITGKAIQPCLLPIIQCYNQEQHEKYLQSQWKLWTILVTASCSGATHVAANHHLCG